MTFWSKSNSRRSNEWNKIVDKKMRGKLLHKIFRGKQLKIDYFNDWVEVLNSMLGLWWLNENSQHVNKPQTTLCTQLGIQYKRYAVLSSINSKMNCIVMRNDIVCSTYWKRWEYQVPLSWHQWFNWMWHFWTVIFSNIQNSIRQTENYFRSLIIVTRMTNDAVSIQSLTEKQTPNATC